MFDKRAITEQLLLLEALQNLTQVYGEIASARMKRTRDSVVLIRQFLSEIYQIFEEVRISYLKEVRKLIKKPKRFPFGQKETGKKDKITFLAHNGKTVNVLISSETGLYGEIIPATFRLFINDSRRKNCEITIIGKQGLALFIGSGETRPYTFFNLPEKEDLTYESLSDIVNHIVQYEEIRLYYGKFLSIVSQKPECRIITSEIPVGQNEKEKTKREYIFEPDLEKILMFFETEMFASSFYQAFREGQLAKYASRILAMDAAYENIQKAIKEILSEKLRFEHKLQNRKQLNALPAIVAIKGGLYAQD